MSDDQMADFFIQWKNVDVCMDLWCSCGQQSHYDGFFAYAVKCPSCGSVYDMPPGFKLGSRASHERWHTPVVAEDPEVTTARERRPVEHVDGRRTETPR